MEKRALGLTTAALCLIAAAPARAAQAPELVLNNTNGPPFTTERRDGFLDRVAQEAFARAGRRVRLVVLPPERGLLNANAGIEDGDLTRVAGIEEKYPNLVAVPEKIIDWRFSAFTRRPDVNPEKGWRDLLPYRVGIIKGWKIAEANLKDARSLVLTDDVDQLFRVLAKDRVDLIVYSRELGLHYVKSHGLGDVRLIEPVIETRPMYVYLHKKHAALVPKLAQALRSLKEDGGYERLYRVTISRALESLP